MNRLRTALRVLPRLLTVAAWCSLVAGAFLLGAGVAIGIELSPLWSVPAGFTAGVYLFLGYVFLRYADTATTCARLILLPEPAPDPVVPLSTMTGDQYAARRHRASQQGYDSFTAAREARQAVR